MENPRFLTPENLDQIRIDFGTPTFVYDEETLRANARAVKNFPNAFGLIPRYAMKSAPTGAILRIFNSEGLGIDASSEFEVERAVRAGYGTESISMNPGVPRKLPILEPGRGKGKPLLIEPNPQVWCLGKGRICRSAF